MQTKPRSRKLRAEADDLGQVINIDYHGFVVSIIGEGDQAMWDAMSRQERRKMISDLKGLIKQGALKTLEIPLPNSPLTKVIYVPGSYQGTAESFISLYKKRRKDVKT